MHVTVFCVKEFRGIHYHPKLEQVDPSVREARPHLSLPHEHSFKLTVEQTCSHLNREKDLLNLSLELDKILLGKTIDFESRGFEQICMWFKERLPDIASVTISADGVEGAKIVFEDS